MAFEIGAIVGRLQLKKDQWDQSIRKVKDDQKSLNGLVIRNSKNFKKMGRTMTIAGGAIIGAVGLMVKGFADFDQAMTESLAIMGDVSDEMRKDMADAALEMSTKTTFAAKELAAAYFYLASAGMDATQSIKALPVVAKFAQAGTFDLAVATDLLTDAQTAMGLSSKDAVENQENLIKVSDILVKANTLANGSVLQFAEALTNKAAAALVNVNKHMEEGVAVLAAFADKGVKGQKAGMRLSMMLNSLDISAMNNKKAWEENGLALFDANEEMRNIGDIIGDLEIKLGTMTTKQKSATLAALGFNVRTKASILTLMGSSEKIKQWEKDLKNAAGTTEEVANKQLLTLNNQFILLKNTVTKAAISVGETLTPTIESLVLSLKGVVAGISEWIKKHPELTGLIAKSTLAIGGLLAVLGPFTMMLPGIAIGLTAIGVSLSTVTIGFAALALVIGVAYAAYEGAIWIRDKWEGKVSTEQQAIYDTLEAWQKLSKAIGGFTTFLEIAGEREIISTEKRREIWNKYKDDFIVGLKAISEGQEGPALKKLLKEIGDEHYYAAKAGGAQEKALDDVAAAIAKAAAAAAKLEKELKDKLNKALKEAAKNSKETASLVKTMTDELMKSTRGEYEYRIWTAQQIYKERKKLLEDEGADKAAFALLEKVHAEELREIEEDRTNIAKEQYKARGKAISAYFEMVREKYAKFQDFVATYTDIIKKYNLEETDYKLFQLNVWYEKQNELLKNSLGNTALYNKAKIVLDMAYAEEEKEILKGRKIDWESVTDDISRYWQTGIAEMIANTTSMADLISNSFNILSVGIGSAVGDMVKGIISSIGAMAGPVGAIIGGIVSSAVSAFTKLLGIKSKAEREAEKAAKIALAYEKQIQSIINVTIKYGEISDATAEKIVEAAKHTKEHTAVSRYLHDIIKDIGVTQENINMLWIRAGEVVDDYTNKQLTSGAATEVLNDSFKMLMDGAKEFGEEGSIAMTRFILKVRETRLEVRSVSSYIVEQLGRIPEALSSLVDSLGEVGGSVEDTGVIALGTFNAMIASGMSWTETVKQMKEPLAALRDKYAELGVGADSALQKLFDIAGITEKHEKLFTAIDANKEIMEALGNSGWLTNDAMKALTSQATDYYKQLKEAGLSSNDAIRAMAPTLQKIYDYAKAYGLEIDDATQGLLDEAKAVGLVEEAKVDRVAALDDAFNRWADRLDEIFGRKGEGTGGEYAEFQEGGTFTVPRPTTIRVHPNELIDITPFSKLKPAMAIAGGSGAGDIRIEANFNVETLAVRSDEDIERIEEAFRRNIDGLSEKVAGHLRRFD